MVPLAMQDICAEGLEDLLGAPDALSQAIYRLYRMPLSAGAPGARLVVLRDADSWGRQDRIATTMEPDALCQLLWTLLSRDGCRIGEVVYDQAPQAADCVVYQSATGYLVSQPVDRDGPLPAERHVLAG